jgi:hypothetical protein
VFIGGTDVADGKVASESSVAQHSTTIPLTINGSGDFLSSLQVTKLSMLQVPDTAATVSGGVSDGLEASFDNEEGFCEVFTDLTDFLLENVGCEEVEKKGGSRKRTATEALLTAMETGAATTSSLIMPSSPIVDHNDYTLKPKKRARTSTVTSESDAESVASTSTSGGGVDRHVQRRVKNNIASRRSRETRKQKFVGMEE